jgi:RimJ/RimL family protein N-acetyltransferase
MVSTGGGPLFGACTTRLSPTWYNEQAAQPSSVKDWYQLMKAVFETTHLLLRPWQEEDLDPLIRLLAKPEVARYLHLDGHPFTREESAEVHMRVLQSWHEQGLGPWAVIDKATGSWIGKLGLMHQADWPGPEKFEVDYELDPACWGRGLATEGTQAALRYGFGEYVLPRIIGATLPEHVASRKVMEKCGLTYQGELQFRHARIVWYALDAATWRQLAREQK